MNAKEFQRELRALEKAVGQRAHVTMGITGPYVECDNHPLQCTIYPTGFSNHDSVTVYADDWQELIDAAKAKWAEHAAVHRKRTIREIAISIIRITAEFGQCTDAALREKHSDKDVAELGAEASADADAIADNGPFKIVTLGGSNGAPDKVKPERTVVN